LQELDEFIQRNFTISALAGIALNGGPSSIRFGRQLLNHEDTSVKVEALRIIERFGDSSDIQALVDLAKDSHGELKTESSVLALRLASDYEEAVIPLLETEDKELVNQVIKHIWNDDLRKARPVLEPLLNSKEDEIRKETLSYFVNKLSRQKLERMLNQYLERTTYYYNIIHWLDKAVYAPRIVRSSFLQNLITNKGGRT
jgi:HEAT repeat protein